MSVQTESNVLCGAKLRAKRELCGLTVEELAKRWRVRVDSDAIGTMCAPLKSHGVGLRFPTTSPLQSACALTRCRSA